MSEGSDGVEVPDLDDAVFISYTHIDDQPFGPEGLNWVSHLHEQLSNRVEQLFGARVSVWRDDKLRGNDVFPEELAEQLAKVAVLVSVCSPRYLNSEWCQRELEQFMRAAGPELHVGTKSRIFKVLKTPVPLDELPDPLEPLLGYEFYEETDERRVREFLLNPNPEDRWKFYARVDDLAQDVAGLLAALIEEADQAADDSGLCVYLAEATSDVAAERDDLRRELERQGHRVVPDLSLPTVVDELAGAVEAYLSEAQVAVHLLGNRYGVRPEGDDRSIPHIQLDLAGAAAAAGGLTQLIWVAEELDPDEDEQAALLARLGVADTGPLMELVRAPLDAFKGYVLERMQPKPPAPASPAVPAGGQRIYLVHDVGDRAAAAEVQAHLAGLGHVVTLPLAEGSETEAREIHEMSMVLSDAVLIYYGTATEHWVRMKLFDIVKAPGWGRTEDFLAQAVLVAPPASPAEAAYATNEAMVLDASGGFEPAVLEPFLTRLATGAPSS